jgi:glycosyltransferase involved in cell wall biosynthesis
MRIGIDARLLQYTQAGISLYAVRLIRALLSVDRLNHYVAIRDRRDRYAISADPRLERFDTWTPAHHQFEPVALPLELLRAGIDLLHSTDFISPTLRRCKAVCTIHDLAFLLYPQFITDESRRYYGKVAEVVQSADGIIAVSERTRRDIVRLLGIPPERVTVVYHGAEEAFRPVDDSAALQAFRAAHDLPDRFVLFVGTIEPRKNLGVLLAALANARARGFTLPLLIVGQQGWLEDSLDERVDELGLRSSVILYGRAENHELVTLYNLAEMLVLPSVYEGFGFPALEAMACGTPVICSNAASLPEIVGDAALLFSPEDVDTLEEHLRTVAGDPATADRLSRAGIVRARDFSWARAARQTLDVYESVMAA